MFIYIDKHMILHLKRNRAYKTFVMKLRGSMIVPGLHHVQITQLDPIGPALSPGRKLVWVGRAAVFL